MTLPGARSDSSGVTWVAIAVDEPFPTALGGLFFAFELLRQNYPEIQELQFWNYSNFIFECKSRTNPISYCLLKDHADGHAMEPLQRFANALLEGRPVDQSLPYARELVTVGHSTGWDLLTGWLAGMTMLIDR